MLGGGGVQRPMRPLRPEIKHDRDGRFLTNFLAELKKVTKVYLKNDHLRPPVQNFAWKRPMVLNWSLDPSPPYYV